MIGNILLKIRRSRKGWVKQFSLYLKSKHLVKKIGKINTKIENNYIISFTTFGHRLKSSEYTIKSIVNGDVLPEKIYLYIAKKDHAPLSKRPFIKKLLSLEYLKLVIVEDLGPYTKLFYALKQHKTKNIVICDDDIMYSKDWFEALIKSRKKWNNNRVISCHRAHLVKVKNNKIISYNDWDKVIQEPINPNEMIFPTGTGGVLFPPNSISNLATNKSLFMKLSPKNDDIWFWFSALHSDCKFVLAERNTSLEQNIFFPSSQDISLFHENVGLNRNDIQVQACFEYFSSINPIIKNSITENSKD